MEKWGTVRSADAYRRMCSVCVIADVSNGVEEGIV